MTAKVALSIGPVKARFTGKVTLTDLDPPNGYRITGEGQGGVAGFGKGSATVRLEEEATPTILSYTATRRSAASSRRSARGWSRRPRGSSRTNSSAGSPRRSRPRIRRARRPQRQPSGRPAARYRRRPPRRPARGLAPISDPGADRHDRHRDVAARAVVHRSDRRGVPVPRQSTDRPARSRLHHRRTAAPSAAARTRQGRGTMPRVSLTVNGKPVTAEVEGRTLLVQLLREKLGLTGTHVGCDTSQCGACVVHVDGESVKSLHHAGGPGRGRRGHRRSRASRRPTARCIRCRRPSASTTACNAASARPAW